MLIHPPGKGCRLENAGKSIFSGDPQDIANLIQNSQTTYGEVQWTGNIAYPNYADSIVGYSNAGQYTTTYTVVVNAYGVLVTAFPGFPLQWGDRIVAINVILQTIDGKKLNEVVDYSYSLARMWPFGDQSFPLLQYVDPYGNTVFNGLQMPEVQKELELLIDKASSDEQRSALGQIRDLAVNCQKKPHMFLRFSGD
jgi:hypothetical protein